MDSVEDVVDDAEEGYVGDPARLGVGVELAVELAEAVDDDFSERVSSAVCSSGSGRALAAA